MRTIAAARIAAAIIGSLGFATPSHAQVIGELRGGIFAHDLGGPDDDLLNPARLQDVNVEFLFKPLIDGYVFGSIHPHVGVTADLGGGEAFGYAGLTYHLPVALTPFFIEAGLGAALGSDAFAGPNDSKIAEAHQAGCSVMGHAEGSVGVSAGAADVMLTAENYFPVSSCGSGASITNVGARVGFSF
jgi:lipid A 3-O-deacylase